MKKYLLSIVLSLALFGCAAALPIIRGIIDIATLLCENSLSEQPVDVLHGQTVQQFCRQEKNLKPFLDEVLKAKQSATQKLGVPIQ